MRLFFLSIMRENQSVLRFDHKINISHVNEEGPAGINDSYCNDGDIKPVFNKFQVLVELTAQTCQTASIIGFKGQGQVVGGCTQA